MYAVSSYNIWKMVVYIFFVFNLFFFVKFVWKSFFRNPNISECKGT